MRGRTVSLFATPTNFLSNPRFTHNAWAKYEKLANQRSQFSSMYESGQHYLNEKRCDSRVINLRLGDTVTKPTKEMEAAMAAAEVGDVVFGDDPTVVW